MEFRCKEEEFFLKTFKIMLIEGFWVKKYHNAERLLPPYHQLRMMYYRPQSDTFEFEAGGLLWNRKKVMSLKDIMGITKYDEDPTGKRFSREGMKRNLQIHLQSDTHLPRTVYYGFLDEETRDLFYDGLRLIYQEYRQRQVAYRRRLLNRVMETTVSDSEEEI